MQSLQGSVRSFAGKRLGIAVSGGGDSVALLLLLAEWGQAECCVATVDHGLRQEAAEEARFVASLATKYGFAHETLQWDASYKGNLQEAARQARRSLLAEWAKRKGLAAVLLGHTQDDVAETFLMRLSRGSGIEGLAAMPEQFKHNGVVFLRPLLDVSRAELRDILRARGQTWREDPSNQDPKFLRTRTRAALSDIGIDVARLAQTAKRLSAARDVVADRVETLGATCVSQDMDGALQITLDAYRKALQAVRHGFLTTLLKHLSGAEHAPRAPALTRVDDILMRGTGQLTLAGWKIICSQAHAIILRELKHAPAASAYRPGVWDHRWQLSGDMPNLTLSALGESGLLQRDWRAFAGRREALLTTPAVFDGETLLISPVLDANPAVTATLIAPWPLAFGR